MTTRADTEADSAAVRRLTDVRFLDADTAVMHAIGGTIGRHRNKPTRARDSIQTLVATRTPHGWRLAAFQNTRVRPMGAGFLTFLHWSIGDALWSGLRLSTDPHASVKRVPEVRQRATTNQERP